MTCGKKRGVWGERTAPASSSVHLVPVRPLFRSPLLTESLDQDNLRLLN